MTTWTEERIETLTALWKGGLSCTLIASKLGGITRNAVIGKVHRLGLADRAIPSRPRGRPPRQRWGKPQAPAPKISPEPMPPEPPVPATALRLTLMQLTDHTCKCGLGDPKDADFAFCGLPVKPGSRYCPAHHSRLYSVVRTRRSRDLAREKNDRKERYRIEQIERWAEAA